MIVLLLFVLPLLVTSPNAFGQVANVYSVAGYVFDDLNANGFQDLGEPGVAGMMIYADSTFGQFAYTDVYGYWQINNLPQGSHSIEIANAGSGGSRPTTAQKIQVTDSRSILNFGVQHKGYAVEGYIRDEFGRPVRGTTVYVDLPNRQTAITNNFGYYRIENVGYDSSVPIFGIQGGHNIYVQGYDANPVLVNPQYSTQAMPANFTVRSQDEGFVPAIPPGCAVMPTYARYPNTGQCQVFDSPCLVPAGWQIVPAASCGIVTPVPQCTEGQIVNSTQRCVGQQLCTVYTYQTANCSTYQGSPQNCQFVPGQCNYQSPGSGGIIYSDNVQPIPQQDLYIQQSNPVNYDSNPSYQQYLEDYNRYIQQYYDYYQQTPSIDQSVYYY